MRFLLGLGFGALTTLSGALLLDWPAAETVLEPVINPEPVSYRSESAPTVPPALTAPKPTSAPALAPEPAAPIEPEVVAGAAAASPAVEAVETAAPPEPAELTGPQTMPEMNEPPPPELADLELPAAEPSSEAIAGLPEGSPEAGSKVSVWRPFHSQLSAEGFARRLSMQLGYPFEVLKVDAAEYHVVFSYSDDVQRQTLSAQVLELTGYQPRQ
jgi:hypothetical protein